LKAQHSKRRSIYARYSRQGWKDRPDQPALVSLEDAWSWRELDERTTRLAANYLALGLRPGDRIASLMPNRTALIAHYLACFKAGLPATRRPRSTTRSR
jgi:acyl-CoA synthetase (AMP-forming)/AMP-acid ligase II